MDHVPDPRLHQGQVRKTLPLWYYHSLRLFRVGKVDFLKETGVLLEKGMGFCAAKINNRPAQGSLHGVTKREASNIEPDHMQAVGECFTFLISLIPTTVFQGG